MHASKRSRAADNHDTAATTSSDGRPHRAAVTRRVEALVARATREHGLWRPGDTLVVAVSGGQDSLCLLGALLAMSERAHPAAPGELIVAHLDHGTRGGESAADAAWVAAFAERLGVRCVVGTADAPAEARRTRRSLEDAARRLRYAFLRRVRAETGAAAICVGHTLDDQAETILMSFVRGAGLAGLAGMAYLERDIARPLLGVTRAETLAYCLARGWQPRMDPSNADVSLRRNRVRHELLPALAAVNPNIARTLVENGQSIEADERYLAQQTDAIWADVVREMGRERITLAVPALRALPLALRHRVLRRAAVTLIGHDHTLSARNVRALDAAVERAAGGGMVELPGEVRAVREYDRLIVARGAAEAGNEGGAAVEPATDEAVPLAVPGVVELPALGWRVRAWLSERPAGLEADAGPEPPDVPSFSRAADLTGVLGRAETRVHLDATAAGGELWVRVWQAGDRFQPLGLRSEKKLQDVFADAKVPRALRRRIPLVCNREHILWVAGLRIDHRARLTRDASAVLVLQLEPLDAASPSLRAMG
jgi:tRNA(Ile)-lysidine synthase